MLTLDVLTVAVVLGSGMAAGIFFTFSNFVMPALARLPKHQGAAAMQAINITVINPLALGIMLGTGVLALAAAVLGLLYLEGSLRCVYTASAVIYLVGCVAVTMLGNVPLNERLDEVDPATDAAAELWDHYLSRWTFWNTVRTAACALTTLNSSLVLLWS